MGVTQQKDVACFPLSWYWQIHDKHETVTSPMKGLPYFATAEEAALSHDNAKACRKMQPGEPLPELPAMNFPKPGEQPAAVSQPRVTASGPGPHEKPADSADAVGVSWNCMSGCWRWHAGF